MRTLIFSISAGDGHKKTSLAIKNHILLNNNTSEVLIVDALRYISPLLDKLIIGSYLKSIKINPKIYKKIYEKIDSNCKVFLLRKESSINKLFALKLKKLIFDFKPDIILSTHPIPTEILSTLKSICEFNIPIVAVITDYACHSFWLHKGIDAYITSKNSMVDDIVQRGIDRNIVYDLGIPVSPDFFNRYDRNTTLQTLNLSPNKFTVLIMGGSLGLGKITDVYKELDKVQQDIQIIIVTGNNQRLYSHLTKLSPSFSKETRILHYTKEINKYMQACNVLITKPGGITITEAMISSIPLVLFSAIPGHEEKNVDFLTENSLAIHLKDIKNCSNTLTDLINYPLTLEKIKQNYCKYINPNSGKDIYNLLCFLSNKVTSNQM
jgi:processive 1,2-diacylglycerol beta-glucosyltransferase